MLEGTRWFEIYPIIKYLGGKLIASCAIACGVMVLSLPITVIVDTFMQVQEEFKQKKQVQSPHKVFMPIENEKM